MSSPTRAKATQNKDKIPMSGAFYTIFCNHIHKKVNYKVVFSAFHEI